VLVNARNASVILTEDRLIPTPSGRPQWWKDLSPYWQSDRSTYRFLPEALTV